MIAQRVLVNTLEHFRSFPAAGFADVLIRHALSVEFRRPIMPELVISIHALRGEGDLFVVNLRILRAISIHALRGEGDSLC